MGRDPAFILDIILACRKLSGFVAGRSRADLDEDLMLQFAVLHAIAIIGEAANSVPRPSMSSPKSSPAVQSSRSGRVSPLLGAPSTCRSHLRVPDSRQPASQEPGGPRPSQPPSPFCSHAPSRPLQCLSSSRAGGFVRCATSSGRHDLLSVLII